MSLARIRQRENRYAFGCIEVWSLHVMYVAGTRWRQYLPCQLTDTVLSACLDDCIPRRSSVSSIARY